TGHQQGRREGLHRLVVLVEGRYPYLDKTLAWARPRGAGFQDFDFGPQFVAGAYRLQPGEFAAEADDATGRAELAADDEAHRQRRSVPAARRQPAEDAAPRRSAVEVKRLRIVI